ncbi:RNA-directed DNA polymerase, eukaryota, reverse transcriptase zinc-binding domain protein [Tanacetum coccineum]
MEVKKTVDVASKLSQENLTWSFRRAPRSGVEQDQLTDLTTYVEGVVLGVTPDRWYWTLDGSGEFSVASARKVIDDNRFPEVSTQTRWIKAVPIKVNIHAWKVRMDCLPTRLNISRRGIDIPSILCPVCGSVTESSSHLFFDCLVAKDNFRKICRWWEVDFMEVHTFDEWVSWIVNLRIPIKHKRLLEGDLWHGDMVLKQRYPRLYALEVKKTVDVASKLSQENLTWSFRRAPRSGVEQDQLTDLTTYVKGEQRYPRLYALEVKKTVDVASKLSQENLTWSFRRAPRSGVEQDQLTDLTTYVEGVVLGVTPDRWYWTLDGSGEFSVASARKVIDDNRFPEVSTQTRWIKAVPIKVNIHAWKVRMDCLPTRLNISRRGINIPSILCPVCGSVTESSSHLFFDCLVVKDNFRKICRWWEVDFMEVHTFDEWVSWIVNLRIPIKHKRADNLFTIYGEDYLEVPGESSSVGQEGSDLDNYNGRRRARMQP